MRIHLTTHPLDTIHPIHRKRVLAVANAFALFSLLVFAFPALGQQADRKPWVAPARYARKKNRVAADAASLARGKLLYLQNCLSCHGLSGRGDGPAASGLDVHPGNLTDTKRMSGQKDGELFFKIRTGRRPMPSFRKTLKRKQIWDVVNYVRTLSKGGGAASSAVSWFTGAPPTLAEEAHRYLGRFVASLLGHYEALRDASGDTAAFTAAGTILKQDLARLAALKGPARFRTETGALAKLTAKRLAKVADRASRVAACSAVSSSIAQFLSRYRLELPEAWTLYLYQANDPAASPLYWLGRGSRKNPYAAGEGTSGSIVAAGTFGKAAASEN